MQSLGSSDSRYCSGELSVTEASQSCFVDSTIFHQYFNEGGLRKACDMCHLWEDADEDQCTPLKSPLFCCHCDHRRHQWLAGHCTIQHSGNLSRFTEHSCPCASEVITASAWAPVRFAGCNGSIHSPSLTTAHQIVASVPSLYLSSVIFQTTCLKPL